MQRWSILTAGLIAAVLAAGCTTPVPRAGQDGSSGSVTYTSTDGLTLSFSAAKRTFAENRDVVLKLDLQNTGEASAERITATTYGPTFIQEDAGCTQSPSDLSTLQGVIPGSNRPGGRITASWSCPHDLTLAEGETDSFTAGVTVTTTPRPAARSPSSRARSSTAVDRRSPPTTAGHRSTSPSACPARGRQGRRSRSRSPSGTWATARSSPVQTLT
ncbi:MAG: hypothetical protein ABEK12_02735 [Candidatus Nanohaloarchaea archaeon]